MSKLAGLSIVAISVKLNVERLAERVSKMIRRRQCLWYGAYPRNAVIDPVGPDVGSLHVVRGGCWENNFVFCRSAVRSKYLPASRIHLDGYGFRVAMSSAQIPESSEADK